MHDFSTASTAAAGPLARVDARVKLIVAVAAILAAVLSTRAALPAALLAVCVVAALAMGMPPGRLLARLRAPLAVAAAVFLLKACMTGRTELVSIHLGGWSVSATREGAAAGLLIAARVLGSFGVLLLVCSFTPAWRLFAALRWAKAPRLWVEIALLMHRYISTLAEQAASVLAAQKVRLGYAGLRRSLGSMGSLAGIVMLRSIDQSRQTADAMVARGCWGPLPLGQLPPLGWRNGLAILISLAGLAGAMLLAERWPG